ncbi:MAG TPA: RecQ family ATP-dependent DNA helicase, partial [Ktedonobacterales bacterium]|nr:RecQ family ATP-dependent DNA helicase [Ktedonobacterales bacterium]
ARELVSRVFAAYQDAPTASVLGEALKIAERLADEEWADDLRRRQADADAREAANLRIMLAAALDPASGFSAAAGTSSYKRDSERDTKRDGRARERRAAAAAAVAAQALDDATGDDTTPPPTADEPEEPPSDDLLEALADHFGYDSFLPGQSTIIAAVLRGEDVLALLPTGAGKSLCYQLPALLLPGTTVLISPLIALMKDQLEGLPAAVRARATVVNSQVDRDELDRRLRDIAAGTYKLVYAAPERLRQQSFVYALRRAGVARFVVDEAHCVSMWGHDFRPDYLFIAKALRALEADGGAHIPVLALTATATPDVRASIGDALGRPLRIVNRGVFRPNLAYEVVHVANNEDRLRALAAIVKETSGSGIVYVRSRDGCEEVAEFLRRRCGVRALHYHAGMERADRDAAQNDFIAGRARVVVATVAFGMGIDKPDVRFIVHYQLPGSLEAYAQESGRAGRDGRPSRCVLFASTSDVTALRRHIRSDELPIETLRAVYATTRDLIRASAPAGARAGRVTAADLERDVSDAIQATAQSAIQANSQRRPRGVDETGARVALSLLERCGFLLRHPDVPRAPEVRLIAPAASSASSTDPALTAFLAAARLRPNDVQTLDLVALTTQLQTTPAVLEEHLLAWRDAGLLAYRDGARDLLLELLPPPPDGRATLPALLDDLAERHERQIAALEAFTQARECRPRMIARHFGERLPVARCGVCDTCRGTAVSAREARRARRQERLQDGRVAAHDEPDIRETILTCLRDLPYAVGVTGLIRILRGSANTGASAARSPHFAALSGTSEARIRREIDALIAAGALTRDETAEYPVLRLTGDG